MDYTLSENMIKEKIILVRGAGRSGKTTLSRLLASCDCVEWIEEPYELSILTQMYGLGKLTDDAFTMMFNACVHERINDIVLMRTANFRPGDLSSIWNCKSAQEIMYRLHDLDSRDDVAAYISERKPWFLFDMPDISLFASSIRNRFKNMVIISVIRNGYDVAEACWRKGWFSSTDIHNQSNSIFKEYEGKRIPWWVQNGEEDKYIASGTYERALIYWTQMNKVFLQEGDSDCFVRYEDLCTDSCDIICDIANNLRIETTGITSKLCKEIVSDYDEKPLTDHIVLENYDRQLFNELMERFDYATK